MLFISINEGKEKEEEIFYLRKKLDQKIAFILMCTSLLKSKSAICTGMLLIGLKKPMLIQAAKQADIL